MRKTTKPAFLGAALLAASCNGGSSATPAPSATPSSLASAPVASAAPAASGSAPSYATPDPIPPEKVAAVVNPKGDKPYAGPTGVLRGVIRIKGDPPPDTGLKIPAKCGEAMATYAKLFRVGQGGAVGDVLVSVTQYDGYVPPAEEAEKITIHGCAFKKRTLVAAFGQRIEVYNLDQVTPYMPFLDGADFRAVMVAIPGGDAVKYYPQEPGHYVLRDQLPNPFLEADVFVLKYATHDVTGLDGQYEIKGIPVGKARVDAFLPIIDETTGQDIEIKEGDVNHADLVLEYKKDKKKKKVDKPKAREPEPPGPKG